MQKLGDALCARRVVHLISVAASRTAAELKQRTQAVPEIETA
jgi:hypothetical protein